VTTEYARVEIKVRTRRDNGGEGLPNLIALKKPQRESIKTRLEKW
jgi:hypothetical protein